MSCRARVEAIGLQTCPEVDCQAQEPSTPTHPKTAPTRSRPERARRQFRALQAAKEATEAAMGSAADLLRFSP